MLWVEAGRAKETVRFESMKVNETELPFDSILLEDRPWFPYLCTEVEHWEWETSGDRHYNFWAALTGEAYLSCDGQTFRLKPGMFFVFAPGQKISAAHFSGERVTRFSAHFLPVYDGTVMEAVEGFPVLGREVSSLSVLKHQIDAIMRLAFRREDEATLARQLYQLIAQCCSSAPTAVDVLLDRRVAKAIRRIHEAPASIVSMDALAREAGISRSHFDREFSKQVGIAPKQFLLNCKMIQARRYLESSQLRVGEIAEVLGYRDIYFFSRQFKSFFGVSPVHYRKALRG
ncbi:helix-turn-helix domain-containing protein [Coraliomargarita parva]|uniref:helix-turn-helix domain-containing protein n=1 Tax=Coraliomargarita parva TaxID=3014050 RepID=UPI0022B4BAF5|nr:AraC family transcriptional regulator [Coraliomargarita parva]